MLDERFLDDIVDFASFSQSKPTQAVEATPESPKDDMGGLDDAAIDLDIPELPRKARLPVGLGADASPWLDTYKAFSAEWSPRAYPGFHTIGGLWALSTVAARRIVLHLGGPRYPNLYFAAVSRTSLFAKTTTLRIAKQLLEVAGQDWMLAADDSTPQGYINSISSSVPTNYGHLSPQTQLRVRHQLALRGARGWYYEEFGEKLSAIARENGVMADFRGHLRRLDDCCF